MATATDTVPAAAMNGTRRKSLRVDQDKLDRAVTILGARSEAEAIDRTLDLVLFRDEVVGGIERLAGTGGVENYFDAHPEE